MAPTQSATSSTEAVRLLIEASSADTVYGDVYLARAREQLAAELPRAAYDAIKSTERDVEQATREIQAATLAKDWVRVEELAGRADTLRRTAAEKAPLLTLGAKVWDAAQVRIDPFSPGFETLPGIGGDLAAKRDGLVKTLAALAKADPSLAAFCEARRKFFAGFVLGSTAKTTGSSETSSAHVERLAIQAAQSGDLAQLRKHARELAERQAKDATSAPAPGAAAPASGASGIVPCPVDLGAPFPDAAVERAKALGLTAARTEPLPNSVRLLEFVAARIWQAHLSGGETEREGAVRADAAVEEAGFPAETAAPVKVLVGQLLRNAFVNSGGARHLLHAGAEAALIEDFPEDKEAPASGELLTALGLGRRRGLSRREIEDALLARGATLLRDRLGLDPTEFRLVCIPQDLYMRFGRERGWGQQRQWTHLDGYQLLQTGRLRALVGGDVRYGGLTDLVSINVADEREGVIARFAVVRRARQVARWA
jgi:hypothetical protein